MSETDYRCDRFKNRVGYKGQKYAVMFTEGEVDRVFGWQNEPEGGLTEAAALYPGWSNVRVVRVTKCDVCGQPCVLPSELCNECKGGSQ
jgi:hypothetical protein